MPIRAKLVAIVDELRHARTSRLPIGLAERIQHTIVRIEELAASPTIDVSSAETLSNEARKLLDECAAFLKSG